MRRNASIPSGNGVNLKTRSDFWFSKKATREWTCTNLILDSGQNTERYDSSWKTCWCYWSAKILYNGPSSITSTSETAFCPTNLSSPVKENRVRRCWRTKSKKSYLKRYWWANQMDKFWHARASTNQGALKFEIWNGPGQERAGPPVPPLWPSTKAWKNSFSLLSRV